jgi:hypothetical protein
LSPVSGAHFWSSKQPWFESIDEVPNEISESIRQDFASKGIQADDRAILQQYLAAQYQELFAKKAPK